jgi:hypothetical protein
MDYVALAFYAVVCGVLSFFSPSLGHFAVRTGVGAAVGLVSAGVLPVLEGMAGY